MTRMNHLTKSALFALCVTLPTGLIAADPRAVPPEPSIYPIDTRLDEESAEHPLESEEATPSNSGGSRPKHITEITISLILPEDDAPPRPDFLCSSTPIPCCDCVQGLHYSERSPALGFCHQPLYFEHIELERYGHSHCKLHSVVGGIHFFGSIALLPYKTGLMRPRECFPTWGPRGMELHRQIPLRRKAIGVLNTGAAIFTFGQL